MKFKGKFLGLAGDNLSFSIFDQTFPNAYDGCFECDEVLKHMITSDSEYSKLVVWEGEEGFLWSEKPVEGDQTKNKNLQESYAELEIANKRLASALDIEQKKLVPFQQQVTSLKGDLARAEGERDQFKKEVADLQEKLKQVNAGSGDSKKLKDDLKAVSKERDDLKAVNEKLSADLVKATKTAEKEAPKETTGK